MQEEIVQQVINEVRKKLSPSETDAQKAPEKSMAGFTEYVGNAFGDTIGLVIANLDPVLQEKLGIGGQYRSIGIIGSRTGAGPQIMACDEAVKASNTELVKFELPRDTKGGGGHGTLAIFGAEEVSDARRAVEIALKALSWTFGDIYMNEAGNFCELQYTARASYALNKYFNAPLGKAWGLIVGCPAGVGVLMADTALKAANVEIVMHASPTLNTAHTNEFMIMITGDSGAVKQAVIAGREVGLKAVTTLGGPPKSLQTPYIR